MKLPFAFRIFSAVARNDPEFFAEIPTDHHHNSIQLADGTYKIYRLAGRREGYHRQTLTAFISLVARLCQDRYQAKVAVTVEKRHVTDVYLLVEYDRKHVVPAYILQEVQSGVLVPVSPEEFSDHFRNLYGIHPMHTTILKRTV